MHVILPAEGPGQRITGHFVIDWAQVVEIGIYKNCIRVDGEDFVKTFGIFWVVRGKDFPFVEQAPKAFCIPTASLLIKGYGCEK